MHTPEYSSQQIIGDNEFDALTEGKGMYPAKKGYMVRGNGITRLVEIDGQIVPRGQLTKEQLKNVFPDLNDDWVEKILSEYK